MRLGITLGVLISTLWILHDCNANRAYKAECGEKEVYVPFQEDSDEPERYRVCFSKTGDSMEYICPKCLIFNKITRSCTVSFNDGPAVKCTSEKEKLRDTDDTTCKGYYECLLEGDKLVPKKKTCDGYFNVLLRDCVPLDEYFCGDDGGPDCDNPDFQDKNWVNKESCNSYYECVEDVRVFRKCPSGEIFDAHARKCTKEVKDKCKAEESAPGLLVDLETMCKGKVGKFLADPYYCKAYYYCIDELTPYWSTCDPDRYFTNGTCSKTRPNSCTCEDIDWDKNGKDSEKVPDNSNESKYYVCRKSKLPEEKTCPSGTKYDPVKNYCYE
ncbi:unnamed protein product [Hermetia illucens]|uniref:Chitin-binding type-2 domain-containing protein n=1 Tax=Hermetia illucens TaxID=343691 RepID=A0A7R8UHE7_HERIL|nr:uncharacterized protein LOC119650316 [Hermetia illucens]CAD7080592.1 unnamed protein product [Hermetia illucens]